MWTASEEPEQSISTTAQQTNRKKTDENVCTQGKQNVLSGIGHSLI